MPYIQYFPLHKVGEKKISNNFHQFKVILIG